MHEPSFVKKCSKPSQKKGLRAWFPYLRQANADDREHVAFSRDSGVIPRNRTVTLTAPKGCTVACTTDERIPAAGDNSGQRRKSFKLNDLASRYLVDHSDLMGDPDHQIECPIDDESLPAGVVVRAAAVKPDGCVGPVTTRVYYPGADFAGRFPGCLVLSVVVDPEDLLDYERGILATGAVYDAWKQTSEAADLIARKERWQYHTNITQRGRAWERPCRLQIYDGGGRPAVEQMAGLRLTGHASRSVNQKSFNVYFRKAYGGKYLDYELFAGVARYRSFRLLSGGNNAEWLKFKDAFLQELVADRHVTAAASRPAILFLNGEYWGPYQLTEKVTAQMLHDRCGTAKDQIVLYKECGRDAGEPGDEALYEELMSFADRDMTDPAVWTEFCRLMDIRSMADYCAIRIYYGDDDWYPDRNDILWRTRDRSFNEGRWQYVLYDLDNSTGLYGAEATAPETDHFHLAMKRYPLFAAAIRNREFYELFLDALREIGSGNCAPERVEQHLNERLRIWEPLMPDYYRRFGDTHILWDLAVEETRRFFAMRYRCLLPLVESFGEEL